MSSKMLNSLSVDTQRLDVREGNQVLVEFPLNLLEFGFELISVKVFLRMKCLYFSLPLTVFFVSPIRV
jgi:hypothetical protein